MVRAAAAPAREAGGVKALLDRPYLRELFGLALCGVLAKHFVDFAFLATTRERAADVATFASFFGLFSGLTQGLSLLTRLFVSGPLLTRFGIRTGLLVLPLAHLACTAAILVAGLLPEGGLPRLLARHLQPGPLQGAEAPHRQPLLQGPLPAAAAPGPAGGAGGGGDRGHPVGHGGGRPGDAALRGPLRSRGLRLGPPRHLRGLGGRRLANRARLWRRAGAGAPRPPRARRGPRAGRRGQPARGGRGPAQRIARATCSSPSTSWNGPRPSGPGARSSTSWPIEAPEVRRSALAGLERRGEAASAGGRGLSARRRARSRGAGGRDLRPRDPAGDRDAAALVSTFLADPDAGVRVAALGGLLRADPRPDAPWRAELRRRARSADVSARMDAARAVAHAPRGAFDDELARSRLGPRPRRAARRPGRRRAGRGSAAPGPR